MGRKKGTRRLNAGYFQPLKSKTGRVVGRLMNTRERTRNGIPDPEAQTDAANTTRVEIAKPSRAKAARLAGSGRNRRLADSKQATVPGTVCGLADCGIVPSESGTGNP